MGLINVKIVGVSPLLMHSPSAMTNVDETESAKVTSSARKITTPEVEAEAVAYRLKSGNLYLPATAVKGAMVNASSFRKLGGKLALKPFIAGGTIVLPHEIDLKQKKFEVDRQTVVIKATKGRIVRCRPRLDKWEAEFQIRFNDEMFSSDAYIDNIKLCLVDAGLRIGLLDFRPQKSGSFGMFKVVKWEVKKGDA